MSDRPSSSGFGLFLRQALANPARTGAVAPSSQRLAQAMAHWLPPNSPDYVVELGPGTGPVTRGLLARGLAPERLLAVEKSPEMAEHLQVAFPNIRVIVGDATELAALVRSHLNGTPSVPWIVSSLPLMNFSPGLRGQIVDQIQTVLGPGGRYVQFTYHIWNRRIPFLAAFKYLDSQVVWWNMPPARAMLFQKND